MCVFLVCMCVFVCATQVRYYKLGSRRKDKVVSLFLGRPVADSSSDEPTDEELLTGRTRWVVLSAHRLRWDEGRRESPSSVPVPEARFHPRRQCWHGCGCRPDCCLHPAGVSPYPLSQRV